MATTIATTRKERGESIAKVSQEIERVSRTVYKVRSQAGNALYTVADSCGLWSCDCLDFKYRGVKCKHIFAVEFALSEEQLPHKTVSVGLW